MRSILVIFAGLLLSTSALMAQRKAYEIEVQILHNEKMYFDTIFSNNPYKASLIIQEIVSRYSTEKIYINSNQLHGLYVFNISDEHWKESHHKGTATTYNREIEINLDSLFQEFRTSLERQWKDFDMDRMADSVDKSVDDLKAGLKEFKMEADPHFDALKDDMKDLIEKIRKTRIVIIQEGDTIKID
jgi:gas vesicle protein